MDRKFQVQEVGWLQQQIKVNWEHQFSQFPSMLEIATGDKIMKSQNRNRNKDIQFRLQMKFPFNLYRCRRTGMTVKSTTCSHRPTRSDPTQKHPKTTTKISTSECNKFLENEVNLIYIFDYDMHFVSQQLIFFVVLLPHSSNSIEDIIQIYDLIFVLIFFPLELH